MKTNNIRIHLIIATFILFKSWIAAIEVQNQNINNSNKSDELSCQKTFEYDGIELQHCYDDPHCKKYGDCCRDSKFYNESEQTVAISGNVFNNSLYGCSGTGGKDMLQALIINRCPQEASLDRRIRDKCEGRADDFLSANPVSSNYSGHVYKNIWCAWCNGEREQVDFLRLILFRCPKMAYDYEISQNLKKMIKKRGGRWYLHDYNETKPFFYSHCKFHIEEIYTKTPLLRNCVKEGSTEIVDGCPNGMSAAEAKACASHTYIVFEKQSSDDWANRVFRNVYCARCNGLTVSELSCEPTKPLDQHESWFKKLSLSKKKKKYQLKNCKEEENNNILATKCNNVIKDDEVKSFGLYYYNMAFSKDEYDKYIIENWTEYVYENSMREYPTSLEMGVELINLIFIEKKHYLEWMNNATVSSEFMMNLSSACIWGVWVSVAALVAHLLLFVWGGCRANAEPKNLPERNLASLSVALLIGYAGILFNSMYSYTYENNFCLISALATQFGFLAAFAWMFVISVDMWIVLHVSTKKLRVVGGQRYGRFVVYSLFAWLVPAAFTALSAAISLGLLETDKLFSELNPEFQYDCWFNNQQSLIALFLLPAGIAGGVSCLSFFDTVRLIFTYDKILKSAVDSDGNRSNAMVVNRTRRNLTCYVRLLLMMGPTWMIALLDMITNNVLVLTLNTALNSLQGVFIFIAFDCNQNTLHKLAVFRKHTTASETQNTTTNSPSIASTQIE